MGIKGLLSFFKKKIPPVGHWYLVDFTEAAKEYSVGANYCKTIYVMYNNNWTGETEKYSEAKVKVLQDNSQVVIDVTQGQLVPQESVMIPRTEAAFGTIQLFKRVY